MAQVRRLGWVDALILAGLAGIVLGAARTAREWTGALRPAVEIDLSAAALPRYALLSLGRGIAAYLLSLGFSLVYGFWAAKDRRAERVLLPLLDILQSIPVLGFMPALVLALVGAFPASNVGLELAAVLMIFTGQAWNMTFSFYSSLRSVPQDLGEAATAYRLGWWQRLRRVELPFAAIGLVWNSMLSMAGGWFFLMISEAFVLGERDFRLPGLGSYMSVAVARGDRRAMVQAVLAMMGLVVLLDQLVWRPLVAWAQKFRVGGAGQVEVVSSWFLEWLLRSRLLPWLARQRRALVERWAHRPRSRVARVRRRPPPLVLKVLSAAPLLALAVALGQGAWQLAQLLAAVPGARWREIAAAAVLTLGRVLLSTALGTLWALPVGLVIGLSPRVSRVLQPVVQVLASFPAPMLFPAVVAALSSAGVPLGLGSIALMLLGAQWYIVFNVIAGAMAIPADLREAARSYRLGLVRRFRELYLPAVFAYLVTGWMTATGAAWNASIVAEYVSFRGEVLATRGLGALISQAAAASHLPVLAASVVVMAAVVVTFNRLVWRRLSRLAERRFVSSP